VTLDDGPERILVGIDEHDASARAVQWVAERAGSRRLCVTLLDVTDGSDLDPVLMDARLAQFRRRILQVDPDVEVRVDTRYGDVVGVLLDETSDTDLLVIGSRRSQPVRSALEGSNPVVPGSVMPPANHLRSPGSCEVSSDRWRTRSATRA
jgi:nucleotide-binding universal stress UspA family protein